MALQTTGLTDMAVVPPDAKLLENVNHTWSVGPLTLDVSIDLAALQITVTALLFGIQIDQAVLDPHHASDTLGGSAGGFTAKLTVTADFEATTLEIDAEVCSPIPLVGCRRYTNTTNW
jgi:hypothetical protein